MDNEKLSAVINEGDTAMKIRPDTDCGRNQSAVNLSSWLRDFALRAAKQLPSGHKGTRKHQESLPKKQGDAGGRPRASKTGLSVFVFWVSVFLWLSPSGTASARAEQTAPTAEKKPQAVAAQPDPGLYMTFETTLGNITCKLYEKEAPITVRTIVGLALGKQSYLDPRTKQKVTGKRFYDGLTFHRVIPEFMIQGGDPLGNGTGGPEGPGFPFEDEFVPALRFDVPGRLAMANAGPRTNSSQFFITEVPTTSLNNRHTIFGQCGNLDVVKAIARVPTREDRPIKAVIMKRVVVERVGPAPPNAPEAMPAVKKAPAPVKKSTKKP
jgi:peptidyl-prolyl cis-trans isomerase A (cyclophilin A)